MHHVGIDLVDTAEVSSAIERWGERYLERVFTARELAECSSQEAPDTRRLACRVAAKEATMKLFGTSRAALPWTDIEVLARPRPPRLELSGSAAALADEMGIGSVSLSFTCTCTTAAAVVLANVSTAADRGDHGD